MKLLLLFLPFLFIAHGKSIDPSQASWHKKLFKDEEVVYIKQQNLPMAGRVAGYWIRRICF